MDIITPTKAEEAQNPYSLNDYDSEDKTKMKNTNKSNQW